MIFSVFFFGTGRMIQTRVRMISVREVPARQIVMTFPQQFSTFRAAAAPRMPGIWKPHGDALYSHASFCTSVTVRVAYVGGCHVDHKCMELL